MLKLRYLLAEQAFEAFLRTDEGREAFLQGSEAVGLKRVIGCSSKRMPVIKGRCPFKQGSMLAKAWEEGVKDKQREYYNYLEKNDLG